MKICRFDEDRLGIVEAGQVADITSVLDHLPALRWPVPAGDHLIRNFSALKPEIGRALQSARRIAIDRVSLLSPIGNPSKIIAAPVNYAKHVDEARVDPGINFGADIKSIDHYGLFLKSNTSVVGPSEGVTLPVTSRRIDHEVEIVVVMGQECFGISERDALSAVFGYCIGLDMSVRGTEDRSWRKSFDSFTVLGPYVVTADELADPDDLSFQLEVNGVVRQQASTTSLIFSIPKLIAYASAAYRLYPGDVIMTGTPEGVGPVGPDDIMQAAVAGIGEMNVRVLSRVDPVEVQRVAEH